MLTAMVDEKRWARAIGQAIDQELGGRPQRRIAERTGIDASTISKIISGQQMATLDQIDLIADALGSSRRVLLIKAGFIEDEGDVDVASLEPRLREVVLGAYQGALQAQRALEAERRIVRATNDGKETP